MQLGLAQFGLRLSSKQAWSRVAAALPMVHCHNIEAMDHSFRDLCNSDKPFGGLSVVFGGNFQQILPVILKGSRAQVVGTYMRRSRLWRDITVLHLYQNMWLNTHLEEEANFASWQLEVGK